MFATGVARHIPGQRLDQLAVDPAAEGQGYGTALVAEVVAIANRLMATEVHLTVWGFNERAIALYERMGFVGLQLRMINTLV